MRYDDDAYESLVSPYETISRNQNPTNQRPSTCLLEVVGVCGIVGILEMSFGRILDDLLYFPILSRPLVLQRNLCDCFCLGFCQDVSVIKSIKNQF